MGDSKCRTLAIGELRKFEAESTMVKEEMQAMDDLSDDLERSFRVSEEKYRNLSFTGLVMMELT